MALQISRAFKDISLSFARNPITNDVTILKNEDAIKKSVINLVKTEIGERFFNNLLGTSVQRSLFELQGSETSTLIQEEIQNVLNNFEPRITLNSVYVDAPDDTNDLNIRISYNIVGLPFPVQNIEFLLQPTRV
jgi:phage baseplate assembly protein W